jgi:hypothetical protein
VTILPGNRGENQNPGQHSHGLDSPVAVGYNL